MNHVLYSFEQLDLRIRRETSKSKHPATITGAVQAGASWSGECFPGILWVHSSLWKDDGIYQQDNAKCQTAGSERA
ncbi:hypothetical protein TNCV_714151 [Trichonephila clavipes]|nr:hypothetical protein TNCV_714151 [Trichonephila clavipes]